MKIKLLKQTNLFLLSISFLFGLFCQNDTFFIHGDGIKYENEITFGLVDFLELRATQHYEFNISTFFLIACSLLAVVYLLYSLRKQTLWSNLFYLIFIVSIVSIYFILFYSAENSASFRFDMNTLSLAIYFYSILIGVISFILFIFKIIFKGKVKEQTIEDHLIE